MTSFLPSPKAASPPPRTRGPWRGLLAAPPASVGPLPVTARAGTAVAEPPEAKAVPGRGICLDLAILGQRLPAVSGGPVSAYGLHRPAQPVRSLPTWSRRQAWVWLPFTLSRR